MSRSRYSVAGLIALATTSQAFALNLTGHQFTDSYRYSLLNDSLLEKFPGRFVGTASFGSIHSPFYYSDTYLHDKRKDIISSNQVLTAGFSFYATGRLALGVEANAVQNTVFNDTTTSLGDTLVHAKINLVKTDSFSFAVNPRVSLPTGREKNFSSQGSVGGGLNLVAEKRISRFHILAGVGGQSSKDNRYADVDHRQLILAQLGLSFDVTDRLNVNIESWRNFPTVDDTYQDFGQNFATVKYRATDHISGYGGIGFSGIDRINRDTYSAVVGIKIHGSDEAKADTVAVAAAAPARLIPTDDVYFAHNHSDLAAEEEEKLGDHVEYFSTTPEITSVEIGGFASAIGKAPYNLRLSQKRANTVRTHLIDRGVSPDLLTTKAYGEQFAMGPNTPADRKVQFTIIKKD